MKNIFSRLSAAALVWRCCAPQPPPLTPQQAGELLNLYYVDEVPQRVLEQSTVESMLAELGDPYTQYFDAVTYQLFLDSMRDANLTGIGVSMQMEAEGGAYHPGHCGHCRGGGGTSPGRRDHRRGRQGRRRSGAGAESKACGDRRGDQRHGHHPAGRPFPGLYAGAARRGNPATETVLLDGHVGSSAAPPSARRPWATLRTASRQRRRRGPLDCGSAGQRRRGDRRRRPVRRGPLPGLEICSTAGTTRGSTASTAGRRASPPWTPWWSW